MTEENVSELHFQARKVTYNVYRYFRQRATEKNSMAHKHDEIWLEQIVAKVTGITRQVVAEIIREGNRKKLTEGEVDFTPKRAKIQPVSSIESRKRKNVDEKIKGIIRRKVLQFDPVTNEEPTVQQLNNWLQKEGILKISKQNLLQVILKLGFKSDSTGSEIVEIPEVAINRLKYLQRIKKFRRTDTNIFFLSETLFWHLKNEEPLEDSIPQIIVVHASGRGFKDGQMLKMRAKTQNDNACNMGCKSAIAAYHFGDYAWVRDNVIPQIEPKSLVVIDSPYFEDDPNNPEPPAPTTQNFTVSAVKVWLERNHIPYDESAKRPTLVNKVKLIVKRRDLAISKLLVSSGFSVIHVPLTHSDLNPIRMLWENVVNQYNALSSKARDPSDTAFSLLEKCSKQKWVETFREVEATEDLYYKLEMEMKDAVDDIEFEEVMVEEHEKEIEVKEEPQEVMEEPTAPVKEEPVEYEPEEVLEEPAASVKEEPVEYETEEGMEEPTAPVKVEPVEYDIEIEDIMNEPCTSKRRRFF